MIFLNFHWESDRWMATGRELSATFDQHDFIWPNLVLFLRFCFVNVLFLIKNEMYTRISLVSLVLRDFYNSTKQRHLHHTPFCFSWHNCGTKWTQTSMTYTHDLLQWWLRSTNIYKEHAHIYIWECVCVCVSVVVIPPRFMRFRVTADRLRC